VPYLTVGKENSAPIDLYYEDHGMGGQWCSSTATH